MGERVQRDPNWSTLKRGAPNAVLYKMCPYILSYGTLAQVGLKLAYCVFFFYLAPLFSTCNNNHNDKNDQKVIIAGHLGN